MHYFLGTDIVYIPKLKKEIKPTFIKNIYTPKEIIIAHEYQNSLHFYATRFAAKEAIIKATNAQFDFKEIEILKNSDGAPLPKIINHPEYNIKLSLSYDGDYAIAFCLITKK